jgi:hypothetical protein
LTVLSYAPEAKYFPSGENAIEVISSLCAWNAITSFKAATLQIFILLPKLQLAKYLPSAENTVPKMAPLCAESVVTSSCV